MARIPPLSPQLFRELRITSMLWTTVCALRLVLAVIQLTQRPVGWYGSAYLLTICGFQLAFGKCYSVFSIKTAFLTAIGIFNFGSLICGIAPRSLALVVGRANAGMGCAGVFSGALIVIAYSVPLHQRPMFTGLVGAMYGVASIAGQ